MDTPTPPKKGMRGFAARHGIAITIIVALFVLLIAANGVYALWKASYNPSFCGICHIIRPYVESYRSSQHTDNIHYQANVGCKECHETSPIGALQEVVAYVTRNYDNPLRERKVESDMCLKCHRSYQSLAARTAHLSRNPHDSHWPNLRCTLCHKVHRPSQNYCAQCHDTSDFKIQP
ncbi:MAG: cytochrome c3 family protein [Anaerolineae bacterium]